jgi:hypothetical protein
MPWDLNESKHLYSLIAKEEIHDFVRERDKILFYESIASAFICIDLHTRGILDHGTSYIL